MKGRLRAVATTAFTLSVLLTGDHALSSAPAPTRPIGAPPLTPAARPQVLDPATSATAAARVASAGGIRSPAAQSDRPRFVVRQLIRIGTSRDGVPLIVLHVGDPGRPPVLVVGYIHGNETAGLAVEQRLFRTPLSQTAGVNLWLLPSLNPDGGRLGRRTNAAGVDLNRNFPVNWRQLGAPGYSRYSGPRAASESETVAMVTLLQRVRPAVGVWFHQALAVVDDSEGPRGPEAMIARALRLPERALPDYSGSAVGFENTVVPHSGFAVELRAGAMSGRSVDSVATAILKIASARDPRNP